MRERTLSIASNPMNRTRIEETSVKDTGNLSPDSRWWCLRISWQAVLNPCPVLCYLKFYPCKPVVTAAPFTRSSSSLISRIRK